MVRVLLVSAFACGLLASGSCVMVPNPASAVLDAPAPAELGALAAGERVGFVRLGDGPVAEAMVACVEDRARRVLVPGTVMPENEVREALGPALAAHRPPAVGDLAASLAELAGDAASTEALRARDVRYLVGIDAGRRQGYLQHVLGGEFAGFMARTDRVTAASAACDLRTGTCGPAAQAHAEETGGLSHILPAFFLFSVIVVGVGGETAACDALAGALLARLAPAAS